MLKQFDQFFYVVVYLRSCKFTYLFTTADWKH